MKALFDTNILIDYLNGIDLAERELSLYEDKAISVITWIEVMAGTNEKTEKLTRNWLQSVFTSLTLDKAISDLSVNIRKQHRIKLPDAIIYATAQNTGRLLISRNTKDFSPEDPVIRVPYKI